jgi:hypothetical protein
MSDAARPARTLALILGMPLVLAVIYYAWLAVRVAQAPFSRAEMDWNGDGRTTLGEFFATADVIAQPVRRGDVACQALLSARTGDTLRIACPDTMP